MQQDNRPNDDVSLPGTGVNWEALRRDIEYVSAESVDYLAYELDTGRWAMAPTREEALAKLKELAPDANRIFCDKMRLKVKRNQLLLPDDIDT